MNPEIKKYKLFIALVLFLSLIACNHHQKEIEEPGFDKPEGFAEYYRNISTSLSGQSKGYQQNNRYNQLNKLKQQPKLKSASGYNWVQRGPGNVSGRTRAILVDKLDASNKTWFAGSASGGIWKTTDSGESWRLLTADFPNLSTSTLVQSTSDPTILYTGTGEGFGGVGMVSGAGIFKSTDHGETWEQLASTTSNDFFEYVNRLVIDPENPLVVLAATNKGIIKTEDGGQTWKVVYQKGYRVQDIEANPENFKTIYAASRYLGPLKSTNAGESWQAINKGVEFGYRHEIAVSPVDTSVLYLSVEAPGYVSKAYISYDAGDTWYQFAEESGGQLSFLGVQGWFNNIIAGNPFDINKVFIGGVYLGAVDFSGSINQSESQYLRVDTSGTANFMNVVNFGGQFLGGGLAVNTNLEDSDLEESDFSSIEIRFGKGKSQKAHRFTVPEGEGPGVPDEKYTYQDYTEVPFEVWDTDINQQLMVSFRDQERDGSFNLIEREADERINGREYIYVHALPYDFQPDENIAQSGGQIYKELFFIWPTLVPDSTWDADNLPDAFISLHYGQLLLKKGASQVIADDRKNAHVHVDHHDLVLLPTNTETETFTIISANDGGLGVSYDNAKTWQQITNGYNTTQLYGVAKRAGKQQYIGGMQDNGTWRSDLKSNAVSSTPYEFMIEGDGFEAVWHPTYQNRIIGSSYNNYLKVSLDTGRTWQMANEGINNDGPFVTRIASHPDDPDVLFVAGNKGVYRHLNFGIGRFPWELISITDTGYTISTSAASQHVVTVSLADKNIVWAGEGMNADPELKLFVSKNQGNSFKPTSVYSDFEMGYVTNIATHPMEKNTAYALFSIAEKPKILRTNDLGQTWEDITQFENGNSLNGYPDVMTYCLLVMPFDPNIIWAGTEIGILESVDNGISWHLANNGFPNVSVWQMKIQDQTLIIATHGLGIWTADLNATSVHELVENLETSKVYPNPVNNYLYIDAVFENEFQYFIFNLSGSLVQQGYLVEKGQNQMIDCSNLDEGSYVVKIKSKNREFQHKIIVAH